VYCSSEAYSNRKKSYKGAELRYIRLKANGWQSLIYDTLSIIHAAYHADTILLLGVGACFVLPLMKMLRPKVKFIVNLDGLDYKREKWNRIAAGVIKSGYWVATRFADLCISDNMAIQEIIYQDFHRDSTLIEYGGDHQAIIDVNEIKAYGLNPKSYYVKVARIEPENKIETVLKAFAAMPDKKLILVGTWKRNEYAINLHKAYERCPNILMLDPIYEINTLNSLRFYSLAYIHGHSVGGTNPTLVEAMHLGIPIIAYDVIYNRSTTEGKCLYFTDSAGLKRVICETSQDQLHKVAQKMLEISKERYVWSLICDKYEELYS
jgi:glycosyltransferase involved in cell wall biosynthesis